MSSLIALPFHQAVYLSLLFLAKGHEHLFVGSENIVEAFCSLLRRDLRESYKSKGNALVSILAANVLLFAFRNEKTWPEIFVRVYIEVKAALYSLRDKGN